ncbi:MAG TPA: FAD-dependent oxidoreductase [Tepidisphaeraceae bacterium]|jgi:pyruvate/2-oxoglutarate dehydrogenase complex dihydrolipoamide dehydrogenase (E3) component
MTNIEEYDVVVLGSGKAGKLLAWTLAAEGKRVAVVERQYVGGACPNIACLPSKNVIHSAKVASYLNRGAEFGIAPSSRPIDMVAVRDRKRRMVESEVEFHLQKYRETGAELIMGRGRFIAPKTLEVALNTGGGTRTVRGRTVAINTGSRARIDDTPGLIDARPLTHVEALELDQVPPHLIVLGAGFVGLEFAQAMRRFGSRVTLVERNGSLLHREDPDVSDAVGDLFRDEEIEVVTGTNVRQVEGRSGQSVRLQTSRGAIEGTHLLAAGGRTPNTDGIGLERTGVETNAAGHVKVNERLQTTAEGVWAMGDCAGSPYFTHIAFDDFRVVRDNVAGGSRVTTGRQVPFCMFIDPELARVGLSEREANERGIPYRLLKMPMQHVLRTHTLSETRGFMKALVEAAGDRILGFTAFGVGAGEVMAVVQVAMKAGLPYTLIGDMVLTHPTIAEGLSELFATSPMSATEAEQPRSPSRLK